MTIANVYPLPPARVAFFADGFAVLDPIEPGLSVRDPLRATVTTSAGDPVAVTAKYTDEQASVVVEDSDSFDPDAVEHTRQSRLQRWQEQRP